MQRIIPTIAMSFVLTLASSCASGKDEEAMPLLSLRDLPGQKVDLFKEIRPNVLSSSEGRVEFFADGKLLKSYSLASGDTALRLPSVIEPRDYRLRIENEDGLIVERTWRIRYPTLGIGSQGRDVRLLHQGLRSLGYMNAPKGNTWDQYTGLAVLAFRKTNDLGFEEKASPEVLRMLLRGEGAFPLREQRKGRYVEVDLTRQVMVLVEDGKPQMTYHISSGTSSTPSDLGRFIFYSKVPGYNAIGMYYSVFYNRGEATHGYASVPDYPASHGCIRNPIPSSLEIYNWIPLGAPIWVYL